MADQQSAEEIHTTINRNFNRRKVDSLFIDNIQGRDLADMQLAADK